MTAASPPVQLLAPTIARLALVDGRGAPFRTQWVRSADEAPLFDAELHTQAAPAAPGATVRGFPVGISAVHDPRALAMLEAATRQAGVAVDGWLPETHAASLGQGYRYQHWLLPWLVVWRGTASGFLYDCLAIEHPARAGYHDLWWPRDAPPPLRAWQWIRDTQAPPVPT